MQQEGLKFDMQIMTWLNGNKFFSAAFEQYQLESDMQLFLSRDSGFLILIMNYF